MYKVLSKIFGILTLVFGILFLWVKLFHTKFAFLKEDKSKNQIIAAGANNNSIKGFLLKCAGAVAPIYAAIKIKTILQDHKKAKRRRKLYSAFGITLVALGLKKKYKKAVL